jgi:hypothetical protein
MHEKEKKRKKKTRIYICIHIYIYIYIVDTSLRHKVITFDANKYKIVCDRVRKIKVNFLLFHYILLSFSQVVRNYIEFSDC